MFHVKRLIIVSMREMIDMMAVELINDAVWIYYEYKLDKCFT